MQKLSVAAAVALGYLLGRTRKMKLAIAVAGLLAGRRLKLDPQTLLQQGGKLLQSSPELQKITGEFKNKLAGELGERLLQAAAAAATSAATNRLESLTDKIRGASQEQSGAPESSEPSEQVPDEEPRSTGEEERGRHEAEDEAEEGGAGQDSASAAGEQQESRGRAGPGEPRRPRRPATAPTSEKRGRVPRR